LLGANLHWASLQVTQVEHSGFDDKIAELRMTEGPWVKIGGENGEPLSNRTE